MGEHDTDVGNARETFFFSQLRVKYDVIYAADVDFIVDWKPDSVVVIRFILLMILVPFQYREADMVFYSYDPGKDNASGSDDLRGNVPDAQGITGEIDESAEDAGDGVDVFPEDKGYLVDEDIANDSPDGTGGHTHDDGDPRGESGKQAFFDTNHGE